MTLVQLPQRKDEPRCFIEAPADLEGTVRRAHRALAALGDLDFELHGLEDLADALIALLDDLEAASDELEPEDDADAEEEAIDLFTFAGITDPP